MFGNFGVMDPVVLFVLALLEIFAVGRFALIDVFFDFGRLDDVLLVEGAPAVGLGLCFHASKIDINYYELLGYQLVCG